MFILLVVITTALIRWAFHERKAEKEKKNFVVTSGITVFTIATILAIISSIITIIVGIINIMYFFEDELWWWFH